MPCQSASSFASSPRLIFRSLFLVPFSASPRTPPPIPFPPSTALLRSSSTFDARRIRRNSRATFGPNFSDTSAPYRSFIIVPIYRAFVFQPRLPLLCLPSTPSQRRRRIVVENENPIKPYSVIKEADSSPRAPLVADAMDGRV